MTVGFDTTLPSNQRCISDPRIAAAISSELSIGEDKYKLSGVPEFVINDKPSIEGNENISKFEKALEFSNC